MDVFKDQFKRVGKMKSDGDFTFSGVENAAEFVEVLTDSGLEPSDIAIPDEVNDFLEL